MVYYQKNIPKTYTNENKCAPPLSGSDSLESSVSFPPNILPSVLFPVLFTRHESSSPSWDPGQPQCNTVEHTIEPIKKS